MKKLLLCVFLLLAGCGTMHTMTKSFFQDENVTSEDKKEVILETTRIKETYKQFRLYHYFAIGLACFGLACVAFNVTSTKIGLGSIGSAVLLSAWATYAPANQGKIGVALGGLVLSIAIYVVKKLVVDKWLESRKKLPEQ